MLDAIFRQAYPLALRTARVRSAAAVATAGLPVDEREDWEQEALMGVWRALPRYDNTRGALRTYVERIVANRFSSLMRSRRRRVVVALEEHHHELPTLDGIPGLELRIDLQSVLASLSERDRRLALALAEHNTTEAARKLKRSRPSLYPRIYAIRAQFVAAGFRPRRFKK